ncbi:MAG: hypothetical protein ACLFVT_01935 [Syntrophobacteria bacterium]
MPSDQSFERLKGHIAQLKSSAPPGKRGLPVRPYTGMTFFLRVPRDQSAEKEDGHALLVVIRELGHDLLLCAKFSLELGMAGPYDLIIEPHQWSGGYAVIAEPWNTLVVHATDVDNRHNDLPHDLTRLISTLVEHYQQGHPPPGNITNVGPPLEDADERLEFQEREAALVERARRLLHERPSGRIIKLPVSPAASREGSPPESLRACADAGDLESTIRDAWEMLERDTLLYETDTGSLYARVDRGRLLFIWFSEHGNPPPAIEAQPVLTLSQESLTDGSGVLLGSIDPGPELRDLVLHVTELEETKRLILEWE